MIKTCQLKKIIAKKSKKSNKTNVILFGFFLRIWQIKK